MAKFLTIVAVGDRLSHKTDLLLSYTGNHKTSNKNEEYVYPRFEDNIQSLVVDSIPYEVMFMDTEPDDDYAILRREAYEKADCILLCFSKTKKRTFRSLYKKWCTDVRRCAPFTPLILVGIVRETRSHNNEKVSTDEGENLKLLIGAYAFVECSVENFTGVDDVFIEAVRSTCHRR